MLIPSILRTQVLNPHHWQADQPGSIGYGIMFQRSSKSFLCSVLKHLRWRSDS
jgi:hypothetical protein